MCTMNCEFGRYARPGFSPIPRACIVTHFNLLFLQQCIVHVAPCIWLPESVACVCVSPGLRLSTVLIMQSDSAGPLRASLYDNTLKIIRPSCLGLNGLPARPVCVCVCVFLNKLLLSSSTHSPQGGTIYWFPGHIGTSLYLRGTITVAKQWPPPAEADLIG